MQFEPAQPYKECSNCHRLSPARALSCECGYDFESRSGGQPLVGPGNRSFRAIQRGYVAVSTLMLCLALPSDLRGDEFEPNMAFLAVVALLGAPLSTIGVIALFYFGPQFTTHGPVMWTVAIALLVVPAGLVQWFFIGPWLAAHYDRSVGVRLSEP